MSGKQTQAAALTLLGAGAVVGLALLFLADSADDDLAPRRPGGDAPALVKDRPAGGAPGSAGPAPAGGGQVAGGGDAPSGGSGAGDASAPPPVAPPPAGDPGGRGPGPGRAHERPAGLTFRCVDAAGLPLAGVRIEARRASGAPLEAVTSDPEGRAAIAGVAPGEAVSGSGRHALTRGAVAFGPVRAGSEVVLRFVASETGRIEGRIVDDQGAPVALGELRLVEAGRGDEPVVLEGSSLGLSADGWFTATVAAGQYAVSAAGPGLSASDQAYVTVEANATAGPITLHTVRQGVLAGRVELPHDLGAAFPVELDVVLEVRGGTAANPYTRTDRRAIQVGPEGTFQLTGCDAGRYRARLELPVVGDHRVGPWSSFALGPGERKADLVLRFGDVAVSLTGVVRDDQGSPVAGAEVSANQRTTRTDAHGRYEFRGLDMGELGVRAEAPGHAVAFERAAYDGARVDLDLVVARTGGVAGRVLAGGQPAPRARVLVIARGEDDTFEPHQTRADAAGRFRLEGLTPGRYFLKAGPGADPFDVAGGVPVDVAPGAVVEAPDLTLQ